jgi:hypothetical protein
MNAEFSEILLGVKRSVSLLSKKDFYQFDMILKG